MLLDSVWVLCPGGFVHPETFRLYETLEAGALPVLQSHSFWSLLFAHELPPFPLISGPDDICALIEMSDSDTEALRRATLAWYTLPLTYQPVVGIVLMWSTGTGGTSGGWAAASEAWWMAPCV
jgi:hypothetical protein